MLKCTALWYERSIVPQEKSFWSNFEATLRPVANTTCAIFDLDILLHWWVFASCGRSLGVTFYISLESLWSENMFKEIWHTFKRFDARHCTGIALVGFRLCGLSLRHDFLYFFRKSDTWVRKVSALCCVLLCYSMVYYAFQQHRYNDFCLGPSVYDLL